ncbi:MAG: hypothetical protein QM705_11065 [Ancrocorticia sp.]
MIDTVLSLIGRGAIFMGAVLALWGAIQIGLGMNESQGSQIKSGLAQLAGGAVVVAAGAFFTTIVF